MIFWHCTSYLPVIISAKDSCFSAPWSPTATKWHWDLPHIGGGCPKFSSQPAADSWVLLGTMILWILWKWKLVSVHAKSFHGPPAILNHHGCSVNKWVIFRNGSPVSFPKFLHSSLDPLAFFYSPLLQKKTKRLQPVSPFIHVFIQ